MSNSSLVVLINKIQRPGQQGEDEQESEPIGTIPIAARFVFGFFRATATVPHIGKIAQTITDLANIWRIATATVNKPGLSLCQIRVAWPSLRIMQLRRRTASGKAAAQQTPAAHATIARKYPVAVAGTRVAPGMRVKCTMKALVGGHKALIGANREQNRCFHCAGKQVGERQF